MRFGIRPDHRVNSRASRSERRRPNKMASAGDNWAWPGPLMGIWPGIARDVARCSTAEAIVRFYAKQHNRSDDLLHFLDPGTGKDPYITLRCLARPMSVSEC